MAKNKSLSTTLKKTYNKFFTALGPQHWWPGDTPFEVIVGAILTQNTAWTNVEKAIHNLKQARVLQPKKMHDLSEKELARLIKPAGYFNIKAKRLKSFLDFLFKNYQGKLENLTVPVIIGPATAKHDEAIASAESVFLSRNFLIISVKLENS